MTGTTPETRHVETALEPGLVIVDPHHHLWPPTGGHSMAVPYSLEDLRADVTGGHDIRATVYLECSSRYRTYGPENLRPVGETEWVASLPAADGLLSGIVGFADMLLGTEAGPVLDEHVAAGDGRFRGTRHSVAWDPSPDVINTARNPPEGVLTTEVFGRGVAEVARRGLVFETWGYFHQLTDLIPLARKHPELTIVVDHLGGPVVSGPYAAKRDEVLADWRAALRALAAHENIVLKLGGIGFPPFVEEKVRTGSRSSEALAAYWGPELRFCIETLGPDRCLFESNFPVDRALCDYVTLWNVFKRVTADLSPDDRRKLFSDTARRVYQIR
jgi:predicted TIM-barrel fold metal-dependent hydrolase